MGFAMVVLSRGPAMAEASATTGRAQAAAPGQSAPALVAPAPIAESNTEMITTLVRTTLVAVHQADVTGNYSVLRDLAAPDFRDRNSAPDLLRIFAPLRGQRIDLAEVVLLDPQITAVSLTTRKALYVAGWLATRPEPVRFELLFEPVDGVWRIDGITVAPVRQVGSSSAPMTSK